MIRLFALLLALGLAACVQAPGDDPDAPPTPPGASDPASPRPGAVVSLGEACGGMMGLRCSQAPGDRQYCHMEPEAMCGAADQMGVCRVRPTACTRDYRPVCGCGGETYANACLANGAGTSVSATGACEPGR
jgi:hypothetical protein